MTATTQQKPILAILLGDATGVGPELVAKILADGFLDSECRPILIGDKRVLEMGMRVSGVSFPIHAVDAAKDAKFADGAWIIDTKDVDPAAIKTGEVNPVCGKACGDACIRAMDMFKRGEINGFVFAPFNKTALRKGGFECESEHQLFAEYLGVTTPYGEINALGNFMTSRVTSHIPLAEVGARLNAQGILNSIHLINDASRMSGVANPRIGIAALNPHGGEHGLCGREEIDIIAPTIETARAEGINAIGPFPSDILFIKAFNGDFDAAVTMYHDQGQIALKLKGFDQGVTIAGGMPMPITTPAHGTAHDIAGKNLANSGAIKNAVRMAAKMARTQMAAKEK